MHHRQSQSAPGHAFGGEERLETALLCFRCHSDPGIADPDSHTGSFLRCAQRDRPAVGQCVHGIKDQVGKYYDPSNYYFGYVSYKQNNYDEALAHFNRINKSKTFGPLSQVYVAQIFFARKQFTEAVAFADTIKSKEIINDVAGIVGQSNYHLGNYEKAVPFLERFNANSPIGKNKQDIYRFLFPVFVFSISSWIFFQLFIFNPPNFIGNF